METRKFFIGNEKNSSEKTQDILSPYQNKHLATVYLAEEEHIEKAIETAKQAFAEHKYMPAYKRADILLNIAEDIKQNRVELAETLALECGKNINFALGELDRAVNTFTIAAEEAKRIKGEYFSLDAVKNGENKQALIKRFPIGPVLGITPFNYPLNLVAHKVAPAIASNNPILIKPSSLTPLSALNLAEIAKKYLPHGMLSILPCNGADIKSAVTSPDIKMISFTGSPAVGWKLKDLCGKKKVCLELGGNAAVIIDKETDIDAIMDKCIIGAFVYSGQNCIHTQRLYIHAAKFEEFKKKFVARAQELQNGDPLDEEIFLNPMITEQEAIRAENWLEEALNQGAQLLCGGERNGTMFNATVLTNTNPEMKVEKREVFAPIVVLKDYTKFEDAVKMVDDSKYGLQAGIFCNDLQKIMYAYENTEVGGLIVNNVPTFRVDQMPYGGVKNSGFGREGLKYAIEEMTEPRLMVFS